MQSTVSTDALAVSPTSLAAAFAEVPDPRRIASIRYPLPAMLTMVVAAILAIHHSVLAIAEWGADQDAATLTTLGFPTPQTPCQSTLQRLFAKLDGDALAARLTAFCHAHGVVLAQEEIAASADADRGEAELTVAPALLDRLDWHGHVLTGDALFCQRNLCQQVLDAGGDYLLTVKANQERLHEDIALLFDPPAGTRTLPLHDRRTASTLDYGHGRTLDRRELVASTALADYLDWPGHAQVFRIERTWREHDQRKRAIHYGITSLPPDATDPARLLALKREHWGIENHLHRAKDVNFGEDASLIHVGQGPRIMALLRDSAVNLLHLAGVHQIATCLRRHRQHPERRPPRGQSTPHSCISPVLGGDVFELETAPDRNQPVSRHNEKRLDICSRS